MQLAGEETVSGIGDAANQVQDKKWSRERLEREKQERNSNAQHA